MPQDVGQPSQVLAAVVTDERDPQKVIDLIKQLDRDLVETQQTASQKR